MEILQLLLNRTPEDGSTNLQTKLKACPNIRAKQGAHKGLKTVSQT